MESCKIAQEGPKLGLATMPYEVLANIADSLNFDDVINLGRTCKALQVLLTEEHFCKNFAGVGAEDNNKPVISPKEHNSLAWEDIPIEVWSEDASAVYAPANTSLSELDSPWERIAELRKAIMCLRSQIRDRRAVLREKQLSKSVSDDAYLRYVSKDLLGSSQSYGSLSPQALLTLDELVRDCQNARDEYGPVEDECNVLEDRLGGPEFELAKLERQFYDWSITEPGMPTLIATSGNKHEWNFEEPTYHPVVAEYLSKAGDFELLHENLVDLFDQKASLEEEKESRVLCGLHLSIEDQRWLDTSQMELDNLTLKINSLKQDQSGLKHECSILKLLDEDGEPKKLQSLTFVESVSTSPPDSQSEYVKFPILCPHPGIARPDETSNITTSSINRWLLEQLQDSPLDGELLVLKGRGAAEHSSGQWCGSKEQCVLNTKYTPARVTPWHRSPSSLMKIARRSPKVITACTFMYRLMGVTASGTDHAATSAAPVLEPTILAFLGAVSVIVIYAERRHIHHVLMAFMGIMPLVCLTIGNDPTFSECQLAILWIFTAGLIVAWLKEKLTKYPRTGGLTALIILGLGVSSAASIAHSTPSLGGRYASELVLTCIGSLATTTFWSWTWLVTFHNLQIADRLEAGDYDRQVGAFTRRVFDTWINHLVTRALEALADRFFGRQEWMAGLEHKQTEVYRDVESDLGDAFAREVRAHRQQ